MTEAFILGAGFSRAVSNNMPLLPDLTNAVVTELGLGSQGAPASLSHLERNIEHWLTYTSQPQPWSKSQHILEHQAMFLRLSEAISSVFEKRETDVLSREPFPHWLARIVKYWTDNNSAVITLNYDTLVDRMAWHVRDLDSHSIYPVRLTDVRRTSTWGDSKKNTFRYYKLHGSANWYYSGEPSFYGETLYYRPVSSWPGGPDPKKEQERDTLLAAQDKVPLIIPPVANKEQYLQHETLRSLWQQAALSVKSAQKVYVIGYSLPETDLGIQFFLKYCLTGLKKEFILVDKTNDGEALKAKYESLLRTCDTIKSEYISAGAQALPEILGLE